MTICSISVWFGLVWLFQNALKRGSEKEHVWKWSDK